MFSGKALVLIFVAFQFRSQLLIVESGPVEADVEQYWDLVSQVSPSSEAVVVMVVAHVMKLLKNPIHIPMSSGSLFSSSSLL